MFYLLCTSFLLFHILVVNYLVLAILNNEEGCTNTLCTNSSNVTMKSAKFDSQNDGMYLKSVENIFNLNAVTIKSTRFDPENEDGSLIGKNRTKRLLRMFPLHPDVGLNTIQMIQRQNYPAELHANILTLDGYLLDIHRIPYGKYNKYQKNKPVVFMMHGILSSSAEWVNMGPDKSLAYILADAGYDVWMGNARGNTFSRKHIWYNPNYDAAYWQFSWHEIGTIDLPTMIDYILKVTGQEKLFYIGYSQGTTTFFGMLSERPDYNRKIKLMVALAPLAYMYNISNKLFRLISRFHGIIAWTKRFLGRDEFLPNSGLLKLLEQTNCHKHALVQEICANIYFFVVGWNSEQLNRTMVPVILSQIPAGASIKQLIHYAQLIKSREFRQYDFGAIANMMRYKRVTPPDYKTENMIAPIAFFYAKNDRLSATDNVEEFARKLPNLVYHYLIPDSRFIHGDFIFAIDVKNILYDRVLNLMRYYL